MIEDILKHGEMKWAEIADTIGYKYGGDSLRKYFSKNATQAQKNELRSMRMSSEDYLQTKKETQSGDMVKVFDGNSWIETKDKTDEDILRSFGVDPERFYLTKSYATAYGSGDKFSIRAQFEPKITGDVSPAELAKTISEEIGVIETHTHDDTRELNAVLPLYDIHFNGIDDDYSYITAQTADLVEKFKINHLHVILGGDFYNVTNIAGTTEHGTKVDDVNFSVMVRNGVKFAVELLNTLSPMVNELSVDFVHGNHARSLETAVFTTVQETLKGVFSGIDFSETKDWAYTSVSGVPIVSYHGGAGGRQGVKIADYLKFIKSELPDALMESLTTGNEIIVFQGHYHTKVEQLDGLIVKQVPAINKLSSYEKTNGWTDATMNYVPLVILDNEGEVATWKLKQ